MDIYIHTHTCNTNYIYCANNIYILPYCCCCSVVPSCPTLCDPMDCSMPGFCVLHYLLEFAQTHIYLVNDVIQSFHPLLSPSPPALNLSQHQGLFQWVSSSHRMAKYWSFSFSISPSNEYSGLISFRVGWFALLAVQGTLKSLLQHPVQKHQFFGTQPSLRSNSHTCTWLLEKPWPWLYYAICVCVYIYIYIYI